MSRLNLRFKIYSRLLAGDIREEGVNHLAMSKLNLKIKIYNELLVGNIGGSIIFQCQS